MGGKKGGGSAHVPYEAPSTLYSKQQVKVLDVLSEGPIEGLENGNSLPFKSIFFDDTPVQAKDGSYNFFGFDLAMTTGEKNQTYLPGFDVVEKTNQVNADLKRDTPITRSITDPNVSSLRVTVGAKGLQFTDFQGNRWPTSVRFQITLLKNGTIFNSNFVDIEGKGKEPFFQDLTINELPEVPFELRVTRLTEDSTTDMIQNETVFPSYVETIDAKLSYKYLAMAGYKFDAMQFGSSLPRINTLLKLLIVSVPTNYDPINRKYVGMWDGSFKKAWSDNPAWVIYDFATNKRYGGALDPRYINRATLYRLAQFCDELVDDGYGGKEPRITFNAFYTNAKKFNERLQDMASACFGLAHWDGQYLTFTLDRDDDPVAVYTNANVIEGSFSYEGISHNAIVTDVHVQYNDAKDAYRQKIEVVEDIDLLRRYPRNTKKVVAEGCTSKSQAHRMGRYILEKSRLQSLISFTVGREGLRHKPHDVIQIADIHAAGANIGGRVLEVNGNEVKLDRKVEKTNNAVFSYVGEVDGKLARIETKVVSQKDDYTLVLKEATDDLKKFTVFNIARTDVKPKYYRALGISDNGDGTYSIKAVEHEMGLQDRIAAGIKFEDNPNSIWTSYPEITNGTVGNNGDEVIITWDNINADTTALTYTVKLFKDGKLYRTYPDLKEPVLKFDNLPSGTYVVEIQARNSRGQLSNILKQYFDLNFTITALETTSELFSIKLTWQLPTIVNTAISTEIWRSVTQDINDARTKVVLPYPINEYKDDGLKVNDEFYYWARVIDKNGTTGEFTRAIWGQPMQNGKNILEMLEGQITAKELDPAVAGEILENAKEEINDIVAESEIIKEASQKADDNEVSMKLLALARVTADQSLNAQNMFLNARTGNVEANVKLGLLVETSKERARSEQYLFLKAETENTTASLEEFKSVVADQNEATSTAILKLKSEIGDDLSAQITDIKQTVTDVDGNVKAMATLDLQATKDGKTVIGGYRAGVDSEASTFNILADSFKVIANAGTDEEFTPFLVTGGKVGIRGDLIASGTISGDAFVANTVIKSPRIEGGTINAGTFNGGSINIGDGNFSVNSNGDLYAKNGRFEGTVYANKIVGDVVQMYSLASRVGSNELIFTLPPVSFNRVASIVDMQVDYTASGPMDFGLGAMSVYVDNRLYATFNSTRVTAEVHIPKSVKGLFVVPAYSTFNLKITKTTRTTPIDGYLLVNKQD